VLILGFGTVGQRALLRLIMNGQFVGSRMRAIIIDRDIENLRDCFLHRYPGIKFSCDIAFMNFDVRCKRFFELLEEKSNVDYVVIALSDDEINKQTALDIRLHYERKNRALPLIAVLEKNRDSHELKQDEIFTFGCREEIYKESVIIREEIDRMAKAVNNTYKKIYGGPPWNELDWFLQESNRASADFIPAMLKLAKLEKKDVVNRNVLTEDTELAEILAKTEHLRWMAFHAAMGYRSFDIDEMRRRFETYNGERDTNDHLNYSRRDEKARLQVCLVSWEELDEISAVYRELERNTGKEPKRNFKENDRDVIRNIPKFIRSAKGEERSLSNLS
jgi:hypothetical protein